jgi:hypothetical protein
MAYAIRPGTDQAVRAGGLSPVPPPDRYCPPHWRLAVAAWLLGMAIPKQCACRAATQVRGVDEPSAP